MSAPTTPTILITTDNSSYSRSPADLLFAVLSFPRSDNMNGSVLSVHDPQSFSTRRGQQV